MIPARMIAARYCGPGQPLRLEEAPVPRPAPSESLVRVRAAGVCHTELQLLDGVLNLGVIPLTPGHEVVGEVVEARGPSAFAPGQRVLVSYYAPCGRCRYCRGGAENLCPDAARQLGFTADGGYAAYLVAPSTSLVALPDALPDAEAAGLACGGATALHAAAAVARVRLGETAVVYGVGGVGFYLVQVAKLAGARVVAIGRTKEKLEVARQLGADAAVDARADDPLAAVYDLTGGEGADVVFDLVASAETMAVAPRLLARRGRLVFAGYSGDRLDLNPLHLVLREIQVLGAVGNTLAELRQTVDLAGRGQLRSVVGPTFPLARVNDALDALRRGEIVGRAVVVPGLGGDLTSQPPSRAGKGETRPGQGESDGAGTEATFPASEPSQATNREVPARGSAANAVGFSAASHLPVIRESVPSRLPKDAGGAEKTTGASPELPPSRAGKGAGELGRAGPARVSGETRDGLAPVIPRPGPLPFEAELLELIGRGVEAPFSDAEFDALARGLFAYQYERNEPYRRFCDLRGRTPSTLSHWTEVPAVPIAAFKEAVLACEPTEGAAALFMSSGTTRPEQRSRHYHPGLAVYDASIRMNFVAHVLPEIAPFDRSRFPFLVLNPRPAALPNSSLAYYLGRMLEWYGASGSDFFVDENGLDDHRLLEAMRAAAADDRPVCVLGTTFAFVHLLDRMAARDERVRLAPGSRAFDTGGIKGRSREIARDELEAGLAERLGVPPEDQVNMYGLTELSTQFIDANLRRRHRGETPARFKTVPPWARTRVLDPETLAPLAPGEAGVLCHVDLANRASVCAILTEDLGLARESGFEILGRVKGTEARGCSIAMDELLTAVGRGR